MQFLSISKQHTK